MEKNTEKIQIKVKKRWAGTVQLYLILFGLLLTLGAVYRSRSYVYQVFITAPSLQTRQEQNFFNFLGMLTPLHRDKPSVKSHRPIQRTEKMCDIKDTSHRFDCHPEDGASQETCEARGCCWRPAGSQKMNRLLRKLYKQQAELNVPFCYYPENYPGYTVTSKTPSETGYVIMMSKNTTAYYPNDVKELKMVVSMETPARLRIKILDPNGGRWQVPFETPRVQNKTNSSLYEFEVADVGKPFSMAVSRKTPSGKVTLLKTTGAFMYTDQFLQLSYYLSSPAYMYGLGEHRSNLLLNFNWTRFTFWARDRSPTENINLYGNHPFYLMMENGGSSHGVFLLNSNAMDVILQPAPAITWRTIGGIIDLYFFLGPTPAEVIEQYTDVIGRSFMPPYWSLGFHLCRYGYNSVKETMATSDRVRAAGIPQDTQWNDIDYMDGYKDFTTDTKNFGDQAAMVDEYHKRGMHYIIIVDPGISCTQPRGSYMPYDTGLELEIFINNTNGKPLIGKVWPGYTAFPDFTNPMGRTYWGSMVQVFHGKIPFDGLWTDMNEISNFVDGSLTGCPASTLNNPPYVPAVDGGHLSYRTVCPSAQQYMSTHYNVHNLYGYMETLTSYNALAAVRKKRPFVISRSTFSGQGHYGGHWTGDNLASYYDMMMSIPAILSMNMFGVTMVGADICGFRSDTTEQLCQRWHQLGAFYPFSRNHNDKGSRPQDPAAFSQALAASTRKVYLTRYSLLPYLYTLMHKSSGMGFTVARPLFFEFPTDEKTYSIDTQFLWGPHLLISPVLTENTTKLSAYFPQGTWYDFYDGQMIHSTGQTIVVDAPLDKLNLHLREGSIVPMQDPALTTTDSRKNKFWLLVALNETGGAAGDLFWDDGDTIGTHESGNYTMVWFMAAKNTVYSYIPHLGYTSEPMNLANITVMGVSSKPNQVTINGHNTKFDYQSQSQILYVTEFTVTLTQTFRLQWTF